MSQRTKQNQQSPRKWFDPMGVYAKEDEEIAREKSPPPGQGPTREDSKKIVEAFRPTEADLERVYTEEELRWLCLHTKFKVRMDWFNPVKTFMRRWRSEGRVQRWSQTTLNKTLNKAILRNDEYMSREFSRKVFDDEREFFRRENTRHSNVCLDAWHHERKEAEALLQSTESDSIEIIENTPVDVNKRVNINNNDEPLFCEDDCTPSFEELAQKISSERCIEISEEQVDAYLKDNNDGTIVKDTSTGKASFDRFTDEINTESLFSTDPEINTQSQSQSAPNSEVVSYKNFGSQIPLTSTQKSSSQ